MNTILLAHIQTILTMIGIALLIYLSTVYEEFVSYGLLAIALTILYLGIYYCFFHPEDPL